MKHAVLIMLAGSLLILNSCTKKGPEGPQGPAGNANVIGSLPFTVSNWAYTGTVYAATFTDSNITTGIVDSGAVEVYKQYPDLSWTNLPDINGVVNTVYNFYEYGFVITVSTSDGSATPAPGTVTFRTVIISAALRQAHPNTNWKNYNEAMAVINAATAVDVATNAVTNKTAVVNTPPTGSATKY